MIKQIHEHILEEIKTNTKTDIIFIITAILLNLTVLAINSALASDTDQANILVILIFVVLVIVINLVVEIGLVKGRQTRTKLINGLIKMYKDNGVDQYYDKTLLDSYKIRYTLFMLAVLIIGIVTIIVPFIVINN